jgi:two-component system, chemotaxis family, CheB/CheR fusion protein
MKDTQQNSRQDISSPQDKPFTIVGIGASAGGLEAIEAFFKAMPVNSGMAFVVIQHLSPDYKSLMVELLSRKTDIPVHRTEDGMMVEPDNIYLIPPKKNLTIFHGQLILKDQMPREGINLPVDIFLRSLAEDQGERAVGIILSGTGSDGTRGVRAIKEWGGLVMVQDEASARFDGMPRAASSTGVADFILPPEEMPVQLLACLSHPYTTRLMNQKSFANETGMTRLFSLLRARTNVDFTYYKPSTITRRIERRIAVTHMQDLEEYIHYAEQTPAEVSALYRELLIGVTSFFRDPHVMDILQTETLPELFQRLPNRELRFWVAGCSTGEEAYTLAILAREVMDQLGMPRDIKIFATDIDRDAVTRAGSGIYPESIAADLKPALLSKYFYNRGDAYQVARTIREMVVFAQHNLVKDPPFPRIDLVSCRNLLIYLQTNLQQRALEMFSFSLRPGGILLLGTSETVGEMEDVFEPIDRKARIYQSQGKGRFHGAMNEMAADKRLDKGFPITAPSLPQTIRPDTRQHERLVSRLVDSLADSYVPLAVVVNEHLEVLYTAGDPSGIFTLPSGRAIYDISKMVNRELAIPLATGIQKVFRSEEELNYTNVRLRDSDATKVMRLRIRPLPGRTNDEPLVVVFFEQIQETAAADIAVGEYNLTEETNQRLQDLEQELQFTRENLQATIEELETSNEELQATNEELLSSNEELQSTNEELQSTNEELYTVNAEYQNKIIELTEVRNDVDNLLVSSRIGTLILDENLAIRRYSPQAAEVFHLVESDIGRPLKHLSHKLIDFDPVEKAGAVQRTDQPYEQETHTKDGTWYIVRILPYYVGPQTVSGVVFTLIDITPLHDTHVRLERSRQTAQDIIHHMPSGLFVYEVTEENDLILQSGNTSAEQLTGMRVEEHIGKSFLELWPGPEGQQLQISLLETYHRGDSICIPEFAYGDSQLTGYFHIHAFRLPGDRLAVSFENISERKQAQEALVESERFAQGMINGLAAHICVVDENGSILEVNEAWRKFAEANGSDPAGVSEGSNYLATCEAVNGGEFEDAARFAKGIRSVLEGEQAEFSMEYPCHSPTEKRWFIGKATRFPGDVPVRAVIAHENITQRKLAEELVQQSEQRFRSLYHLLADAERTAHMGSWTWDIPTDMVTWSDNLYELFQRDPELGAPSFGSHDVLYKPDSMKKLRKAVEKSLKDGSAYELELEAVQSDGSTLRCIARGAPETDQDGTIVRLYGSLQEIS